MQKIIKSQLTDKRLLILFKIERKLLTKSHWFKAFILSHSRFFIIIFLIFYLRGRWIQLLSWRKWKFVFVRHSSIHKARIKQITKMATLENSESYLKFPRITVKHNLLKVIITITRIMFIELLKTFEMMFWKWLNLTIRGSNKKIFVIQCLWT